MNFSCPPRVRELIHRGVKIPAPHSVDIGDEVDLSRIAASGAVIYPGCRIYGGGTFIGAGVKLGYEAPVTIDDCQIGPHVELKGGFFRGAVLSEGVVFGSGAQVREGTILEEGARSAHTVGLKQTLLFPFVTLGSLINFCDCLMAGGTSRQNHSEVGSSYVHFNYTPNQDKATASLIGDVPRGVMLNQDPIFLGGQGGVVGPCRLAFGTVATAGTILRRDEPRPGRLIHSGKNRPSNTPFVPGLYRNFKRVMANNIVYLANLMALMQWYRHIRARFVGENFPEALWEGFIQKLGMQITEREGQLKRYVSKISCVQEPHRTVVPQKVSPQVLEQCRTVHQQWPAMEAGLTVLGNFEGDQRLKDQFEEMIFQGIQRHGRKYVAVVRGLTGGEAETGTRWLQGIVDTIVAETFSRLPALGGVNVRADETE